MTTHASAEKQWTETELARLTIEDGFRLRGLEVTRLDTFIDAAFAFVLTLLIISIDEIPSSISEMLDAAKRIPAFAASFATLMMFWLQHRRWSRRYGLENSKAILTSLALIFVVLVYVYPLKMLFEGMFAQLSGDYLPASYKLYSYEEGRLMFAFYSTGFFAMSLITCQLYRIALRGSSSLALNQIELQETRISTRVWAIAASFGVLSIVLALVLPGVWITAAGYIYFALIPLLRLPSFLERRRAAKELIERV